MSDWPNRRHSAVRARPPTAAGAILALLAVALPAEAAGQMALEIDRPGHVYAPGEAISVAVSGVSGAMTWRVTDMFGQEVRSGTAQETGGHGTIPATPDKLGWFKLETRDAAGDTGVTSFAVVPLPRSQPPSDRFGVMTHFAQNWTLDVLPLVARAGIGQVRDELYWQEVERTKGQYLLPSRYTQYLNALSQQHLKLLLVLSFANSLYDDGNTPYTAEGRAAYAAYADFLVKTLRDQLSGVEVWNEFNGSFCKGPCDKDRPASYAGLLATTYPVLKRDAPDLPVGGGAAVLVPEPWFRQLFEHGALDSLDAVVIHPYRPEPEGVELSLGSLRGLIEDKDGRKRKPIWATEFSHYDQGPDGGANIARYLVRHATIMLEEGVTRLSWYLLRDYDKFTTMGLLAGPDSPLGRYAASPAYAAYATLIRLLDRAAPAGREATDPRTRLYRFDDDGEQLRVGWSSSGTTQVSLSVPGPLERIDLMGNATLLEPVDGAVTLTLDASPIYLKGRVTRIAESRDTVIVADSVNGFTGTLDASPRWSFGAFFCPIPGGGTDACLGAYKPDTLAQLIWQANEWDWAWRSPRFNALKIAIDVAHPSALEHRQVWAVRRWTADIAGTVTVTGHAARPAGKGDGTDVLILLDGKPVWRQAIGTVGAPGQQDFSVPVNVNIGSRVDFVVTPGPATDIDSDATHLAVQITRKGPAAAPAKMQ